MNKLQTIAFVIIAGVGSLYVLSVFGDGIDLNIFHIYSITFYNYPVLLEQLIKAQDQINLRIPVK